MTIGSSDGNTYADQFEHEVSKWQQPVTQDPYNATLEQNHIDRDHDVPLGAAALVNGDEAYGTAVDRRVPKWASIQGVNFDPAQFVDHHEKVEHSLMKPMIEDGMEPLKAYATAHDKAATPSERVEVEAFARANGADPETFWDEYQKKWRGWVKDAGAQDPEIAHPHTYLEPYEPDMKAKMEEAKERSPLREKLGGVEGRGGDLTPNAPPMPDPIDMLLFGIQRFAEGLSGATDRALDEGMKYTQTGEYNVAPFLEMGAYGVGSSIAGKGANKSLDFARFDQDMQDRAAMEQYDQFLHENAHRNMPEPYERDLGPFANEPHPSDPEPVWHEGDQVPMYPITEHGEPAHWYEMNVNVGPTHAANMDNPAYADQYRQAMRQRAIRNRPNLPMNEQGQVISPSEMSPAQFDTHMENVHNDPGYVHDYWSALDTSRPYNIYRSAGRASVASRYESIASQAGAESDDTFYSRVRNVIGRNREADRAAARGRPQYTGEKLKIDRLERVGQEGFRTEEGTHHYLIMKGKEGETIGTLSITESPDKRELYVNLIKAGFNLPGSVRSQVQGAVGGIPGVLGTSQTRDLLRSIKKEFPEAETLSGHRVSGARRGPAATRFGSNDPVLRLKPKPKHPPTMFPEPESNLPLAERE